MVLISFVALATKLAKGRLLILEIELSFLILIS